MLDSQTMQYSFCCCRFFRNKKYIYIYIYIFRDLGRPRRDLESTNTNANETNDTDTGEPRGANTDTRTRPIPNKPKKYTAANFLVPNNLPARRKTFSEILMRPRGTDPRGQGGGIIVLRATAFCVHIAYNFPV